MIPHETIHYSHNLPFSANFVNVLDEPVHCHKEIEILLLLRGFCRYKIYHMDYDLQPGDMIIADVEDLHRIHDSSKDVLMLQVHLDTGKFEQIYPNISATYFVCEDPGSRASEDPVLGNNQRLLRHQLAKLMMDTIGSPRDFVLQTDNISEVLATLVRHFRGFYMEDYQYRISRTDVSETDLDRMSRITNFLLANYDKKVTLEEVAGTEHLNPYYVSHLIKRTLGISFQHFLNGIRLEFAEKILLFSNLSLTQVSEESGFSSLNYFNRCFYDWYGHTPSQYRKTIPRGERRTGAPIPPAEALELTGRYLSPVVAMQKIGLSPVFSGDETETARHASIKEEASAYPPSIHPKILLANQEDLLGLGFLKDRVFAIRPAALLVNRRLLSQTVYGTLQTYGIPVEPMDMPDLAAAKPATKNMASSQNPAIRNAAMALSQIMTTVLKQQNSDSNTKDGDPIPLFGDDDALFLRTGLATPLYTGYQLLSSLDGYVQDCSPQSLQCKTANQLTILLFNPDPRAILNVRLQTKNLPEQFVLMKKQIPEENNCYEILEALGQPDTLPREVVREIDQSHLGIPQFQMVDRTISPVLDLMIYPQHVTLLVISPLTNRSLPWKE
jgi:AraC-like DNA-binding protein